MTANGTHWRWQGIQCSFSPEPKLNKELKVQNMYKSSLKNFQPGLQPNSEQKADEMHVSPAIANALVGSRHFCFSRYVLFLVVNSFKNCPERFIVDVSNVHIIQCDCPFNNFFLHLLTVSIVITKKLQDASV